MDAQKLSAAANAAEVKVVPRVLGFGPMGMIPLVDGVVLTHHPFDAGRGAGIGAGAIHGRLHQG